MRPKAFLLKAVDVVRCGITGLARGRQPGLVQRIVQRAVAGPERSAVAAVAIPALLAMLGATEIRQHVLVIPARGALLLPTVEVLRIAADVDHAVDR